MQITKKQQCRKKSCNKKKTKSKRIALVKEIDKACSLAIRLIDNGQQWDVPRCDGPLCNNHLITRSNYKTRWFPGNCFTGTTGANCRHESNPHYMVEWYINKFGASAYRDLVKLSRGEAKFSMDELEQMLQFWSSVKEEDTRNDLIVDYIQIFNRFFTKIEFDEEGHINLF